MNQRGQVYPLFAFLILVFMAFSALSVDVGYYRYQQRLQQTATDSAALAAVAQAATASPNAVAAAYNDASINGYPTPAATVSVNPSYSDSYTTGGNGGVQVRITKNYQKYFGGVFGGGTQAITTSAVAGLMPSAGACLTSLGNAPSVTTLNGSKITGPNCGIADNGCSNVNGGTNIIIQSFTVNVNATVGGVSCNTWSGGTSQYLNTAGVNDPCTPAKLPYCTAVKNVIENTPTSLGISCAYNSSTCTAPTCTGTLANFSVTPATGGCYYSSSNVTLKNVTLNPGVYIFLGNATITLDTVSGTGVTLIVGDNTSLNFKSTVTLTAPDSTHTISATSGEYGVLLYVDHAIAGNYTIGSDINLTGMVYMPAATVTFNGHNETFTGNFVAGGMTFNGGAALNLNPGSGTLGTAEFVPVLVE